jgi:hypothetical protein
VIRYVQADLEQVGTELARRASEIHDWLDAVAKYGSLIEAEPGDAVLLSAIAQVDLACYQALSSAAHRLVAASEAVAACVTSMQETDADIAHRMCRWAS